MDVDLKLPVVVLNGEELLNGVFVFYDIGVPCAAILYGLEIFVQVEAEHLTVLIRVEIELAVHGVNRSAVTLFVGSEKLAVRVHVERAVGVALDNVDAG